MSFGEKYEVLGNGRARIFRMIAIQYREFIKKIILIIFLFHTSSTEFQKLRMWGQSTNMCGNDSSSLQDKQRGDCDIFILYNKLLCGKIL